jgi:hypothetical protein
VIVLKNDCEIRGDVTAIFLKLTNGTVMETIIDTCDLSKANEFPNTWRASKVHGYDYYYTRGELNNKNISLHRWLMEVQDIHAVLSRCAPRKGASFYLLGRRFR